MPNRDERVYEPDRAYYGLNYERLLDAPDVARALDLVSSYCADEARAEFEAVSSARRANDKPTMERLLADWCRRHIRPQGASADALRELYRAAFGAKGAALDTDELGAIESGFRRGEITGSLPNAILAAEKEKLASIRKGLSETIRFQADVSSALDEAPWAAMTEDELNEFLDDWERTKRREAALNEIRAARKDQKSLLGRAEWAARYPEVFGS